MKKKTPIKEKVKAKAKAVKEKLKGAAKVLLALIGLAVLFSGCSMATPASRATTANYEISVKVSVDESAKATTVNVPFTFGDGALASADSEGSTETQTATPTLDIKPDVNVNYAQGGGITNRGTGGAASGVAELIGSLTVEGLATLKDWVTSKKSGTVTLQKNDGTTTTATCANGICTLADGTRITAADFDACSECSTK